MKAYVEPPPVRSRCLRRIADALTEHAPSGVEIVQDRTRADLVVLHVIGRQERMYREARQAHRRGQQYAVGQWVLRSSQKGSTEGWRALWDGAAAVWSYYDLDAEIAADGGCGRPGRFYHAPLGVDTEVFHPGEEDARPFAVGVTGFDKHYLKAERLREVVAAAARVSGTVWHLGPSLGLGAHVVDEAEIDDATLARRYRACRYVSGLRRQEGFELPAAEGLLCGARPILFDRPAWRRWYEPFGVFVPETRAAMLRSLLTDTLANEPEPVRAAEWAAAAERFSWPTIIGGFWERCLA